MTDRLPQRSILDGIGALVHDCPLGILNTVPLEDVAGRSGASNAADPGAIAACMFDDIGDPAAAKGLAGAMASAGGRISSAAVPDGLQGLCASHIMYDLVHHAGRGAVGPGPSSAPPLHRSRARRGRPP